jgi:hypothetical protein
MRPREMRALASLLSERSPAAREILRGVEPGTGHEYLIRPLRTACEAALISGELDAEGRALVVAFIRGHPARPGAQKDEPRSITHGVSVSKSEAARYRAAADSRGISLAELYRRAMDEYLAK